ncbi:NAD(P)H-dependent oxidoreductase [Lachnospiraceae bacterium NSJ-143]|nr:NAD(P)H-dependent oxidoreductase [Lachnospiraceae bacterium NSJ-143]
MPENVLFVNSCLRGKKDSRTYDLSSFFIKKYMAGKKDSVLKELMLADLGLQPFTKEMVEDRDKEVAEGKSDKLIKLAEEFSKADTIIVAAPYWDMAFPAALKVFYEHVSVCGITFKYEKDGTPKGLCSAKKAVYITTAGGFIGDKNFGYDYTKGLFEFMGIKDTYFLSAEGLDIIGNNIEEIMNTAKKEAEILSEKL